MIMEYALDEPCNMNLNLGTCNSRAGTAAWDYAQHYPDRRHPTLRFFRE
jgi:hypothetical protein